MKPKNVKDVRELIEYARKKNLQDLIQDAKELLDEYDTKQNECNINCEEFTNEVNVSFMEDALYLLACIVDKYDNKETNEISKDAVNITLTAQEYKIVKYAIVGFWRTIMIILKDKGLSLQQAKEVMYGKEHDFFAQIELTFNKFGIDGVSYGEIFNEIKEQFDKLR